MAHAPGQRREIQLIGAALRQVSEARISREAHGRKQLARLKAIALHGYAAIHSQERSTARHRGLRRQATAVAAQALPTTAALTSHRSGRTTTRSPTGGTAATRSLGRTIHLRASLTRRRGRTPHPAVAIPLRHAPTPPQAAAMVVEAVLAAVLVVAADPAAVAVAAAGVVLAVAVVAPAALTNLLCRSQARF
jgi:hypothetical protein